MKWVKMKEVPHPYTKKTKKEMIRDIYRQRKKAHKKFGLFKYSMRKAKAEYRETLKDEKWYANDRFQCAVRIEKDITWLSIKNHEKTTEVSWQVKQWIKNDICGEEMEAVELYPAESRMVNTANQYHLWVINTGQRFPLGFEQEGRRVREETMEGGKQTLQRREG